jgi:hypothetical protein
MAHELPGSVIETHLLGHLRAGHGARAAALGQAQGNQKKSVSDN